MLNFQKVQFQRKKISFLKVPYWFIFTKLNKNFIIFLEIRFKNLDLPKQRSKVRQFKSFRTYSI